MGKNENCLVLNGDGNLWIDLNTGDVEWAGVGSNVDSWCRQQGHKIVSSLEGFLGLDPQIVTLPACMECIHYDDCTESLAEDNQEPDSMYCTAIDVVATATAIRTALAAHSPEGREEILSII